MDLPVMDPTQHHAALERGLPTLRPRGHVVHLAPGHRSFAARVRAPPVAGGDRPAQPIGDGAGRPTDVHRLASAVEHYRHHRGVAAHHAQRLRAGNAAEVQHGGAGPVLQILQPDKHVHLGTPTPGVGHQAGGRGRAPIRTPRPTPPPCAPRRCGHHRRCAARPSRRAARRPHRTSRRRPVARQQWPAAPRRPGSCGHRPAPRPRRGGGPRTALPHQVAYRRTRWTCSPAR